MKRAFHALKLLLVASLLISVAAGCSPSAVAEQYPLESVNTSGSETSHVYRAAGESVPEVAKLLSEQRAPKQMSPEDEERMFLVYSDEWIHLQRDPEQPEDTLVEVSSTSYVQNNYSPSFLEMYLLASVIDDLFDSGKRYGNYRGYSTKDTYQPKAEYRTPTDQDRKQAPPVTVERKGTIIKRGTASGSGNPSDKVSVGSSGSVLKKNSDKAVITKDSGDKSSAKSTSSGSWLSPKKKKIPKTKVGGFGKITRRR